VVIVIVTFQKIKILLSLHLQYTSKRTLISVNCGGYLSLCSNYDDFESGRVSIQKRIIYQIFGSGLANPTSPQSQ